MCFTVTLLLDLLVTGGIYFLCYLQCFHQTSTLNLLQTTSWQWHLCHNINPRDLKQAYLTRSVSQTVWNQMTCHLSNKVSHTPFISPFHARFPWQTVGCTMSWWAQLIGSLSNTLLGSKPQGTLINIPTRCWFLHCLKLYNCKNQNEKYTPFCRKRNISSSHCFQGV